MNDAAKRMHNLDELFQRAIALEEEGHAVEAIQALCAILTIAPDWAAAHLRLSVLYDTMGNPAEALAHARAAVRILPESPQAHLLTGMLLVKANDISGAVPCFNQASQLDPSLGREGGQLLKQLLEHSIAGWRKTLEADPANIHCLQSLGKAMYHEGRPEESRDLLRTALRLHPGDPHIEYNLAFAELQLGDWASGWTHYERRLDTGEKEFPKREFKRPKWTGQALTDSVLVVHCEQGLGDTIQFCRYLALVQPLCRKLVLECPGSLVDLMKQSFPGLEIVPCGSPLPGYDYHVPLLSLPRVFRTTVSTVPAQVPYLQVCQRGALGSARDCEQFKVGVAWAGNPSLRNDLVRSIPLCEMQPMTACTKASFYSLQVGPARQQLGLCSWADRLTDLAPLLTDFSQTAAIIQELDLVIAADTAIAHLAGALGKPVWILLPYAAEWRWLCGREDSPWYPTARLFRQSRPADWTGLILKVREQLILKSSWAWP